MAIVAVGGFLMTGEFKKEMPYLQTEIDAEFKKEIQDAAKRLGCTESQFVRDACRVRLEELSQSGFVRQFARKESEIDLKETD